MKTGLGGSMGRLNPRERALVFSLAGVILLLVVGGGVWYVRAKLADKQAKLKRNRVAWTKIRAAAGPWLAERDRAKKLKQRILDNDHIHKPDTPIKQKAMATTVRFRARSSDTDEEGDLGMLLKETGGLVKKPIRAGKRSKFPMYYRMEKSLSMRSGYVRTEDLWKFLGEIEAMEDLVFVSKLSIHRFTGNPDYAKIDSMTVSTLRWVEKKEDIQ